MSLPPKEFEVKLSMSSVEGRPLSVSLARFDDIDNPLIGCSLGFLAISGLHRKDVIGNNCRFLNKGMPMQLRDRLRYSIRTSTPFMGVLENMRHLGSGQIEIFENLLHLVVIAVGNKRYIIGMQADVTGLNLDLMDGSLDAARLQKTFDSVFSANMDAWVHFQEGMFQSAPLYLHIRCSGNGDDDVYIEEEWEHSEGSTLAAPDQYMVLAPRFPNSDTDETLKWRFVLLGDCSDPMPTSSLAPGLNNISLPPGLDNHHNGYVASVAPGEPAKIEDVAPVLSLSQALAANDDGGEPVKVVADGAKWRKTTESGGEPPGRGEPGEPAKVEPPGLEAFQVHAHEPCAAGSSLSTEATTWTSTMKDQLRALNGEDPANVLSARGISKLGVNSAAKLRTHFSQYGQVKAVHVPFVFKKRSREPRSAGRCFIVMDSTETVARILAAGAHHSVDEVVVSLERFSAKESSG